MDIRKIKETDIEVLANFEKEIAVISFGDTAVTDINFHSKKIMKAMDKERDGMLVLEENSKLYGWLWMTLQTNSVTGEKYINFKSFYMMPHDSDKQYTEHLMAAGMKFSSDSGAKRIVGRTFVDNLPMRLVYKKFGFKPACLTMEYNAEPS